MIFGQPVSPYVEQTRACSCPVSHYCNHDVLSADGDPVLAKVWDNDHDAVYEPPTAEERIAAALERIAAALERKL